jgi:hypothetical protein
VELEDGTMKVRRSEEVETVRRGTETRGDMGTKGVDSVVVVETESARGGVETNSDEDREGPGDESEQRCGPDDEEERKWDASGEGRGAICDDPAGLSTVADSKRGWVCRRCPSEDSKGMSSTSSAGSGICDSVSSMANSCLRSSECRGGMGIGCIEYWGCRTGGGSTDRAGLEWMVGRGDGGRGRGTMV